MSDTDRTSERERRLANSIAEALSPQFDAGRRHATMTLTMDEAQTVLAALRSPAPP